MGNLFFWLICTFHYFPTFDPALALPSTNESRFFYHLLRIWEKMEWVFIQGDSSSEKIPGFKRLM